MAKKVTKKPARTPKRKPAAAARKPRGARTASKAASKPRERKRTASRPKASAENQMSASDALVGLLESPLVADILAAGAAAALASFTHHSLTRRRESGSKQALKDAAKAAATAMGARLTDELDEILESAKAKAKSGRA
jgi:hypothetical protein